MEFVVTERKEIFHYTWRELQGIYRDMVEGRLTDGPIGEVNRLVSSWKNGSSFYGSMNASEVLVAFQSGWLPEGWSDVPQIPLALEGSGNAWVWNDNDGDYHHDEFMSGEADYFCDRQVTDAKPGINIDVSVNFASGVAVEEIAKYGKWVGAALTAIQALGYDVRLNLISECTSAYNRGAAKNKSSWKVKVLDFGEQNIPRDYAILFSDVGFRHIMFSAICAPGCQAVVDRMKGKPQRREVDPGLGVPPSSVWGVEWDPDSRTLNITSGSRGHSSFNSEEMFVMLKEAAETF